MTIYAPRLAERLRAGEVIYTIWSSIPEVGLIDHLGTTDFDCITLDMQHGGHSEGSLLDCLAPVICRNKCAAVRVPVGRNDVVSRALDMGAEAIVSPMVNSVEDAREFADAVKYPPMGNRSWGASRAISLRGTPGGTAHLKKANSETLSFAMIETREAYEALDDVLAVEGIDAVFVGPADLSIAWTDGQKVDPALEDMMGAIEDIAARAKAAGKLAGVFSMDPANAQRFVGFGYQFVAIGFDTSFLTAGAKTYLETAKNGSDKVLDGGY